MIDHFLPTYHFSETHDCTVAASPARVLDAVMAYRPETDPFFRTAIAMREAPMRLFGRRIDRRASFGFGDFTLLGQNEEAIVYGLIGRFWKPNYGLVPIGNAPAFLAFDDRNVAKLALEFKVLHGLDGRMRLVTETRVQCLSGTARLKFMPYWLLIRPVSGLLRRRMLASIRIASERRDPPAKADASNPTIASRLSTGP